MAEPVPAYILELACAVARARLDADTTVRLRAAVAAVEDWQAVPAVLARHGLQALAAKHLAPVRQTIPEMIWRALDTQAREARARALAGAAELRRIARACDAASLPMLAIKGPVLAWHAYGDIGARPFTDLDLLVAPADVPRAADLLRELHYTAEYRFSTRRDAWFRRVDGDYPLVHAVTGQLVELHARPLSLRFSGMAPFEALWERRSVVPMGDWPVSSLGDDDAFLLQALHGAKHRWERLEWVGAMGELVRLRAGDVESLVAAAPSAQRAILLACEVAAGWVDAPLSQRTRERCRRSRGIARLAQQAWHRVAAGATDEGFAETAGKLTFNFRLQRGIAGRLRFAYRWTFWPSPEDWRLLPLPDRLFFAYRVVRPLRLAARYVRRGVFGAEQRA
jgi:Uncharacterised nucleotidyltransferase